jgi:hypothetical protein
MACFLTITKNNIFGNFFHGLAMENVGIFSGHLVCFTAIGYILWPFGIFNGYLIYFFPFWYVVPKKSGNPGCEPKSSLC